MTRKHHVLFTRRTQESMETTKCLRRNYWLMPPLDDQPHKELHRDISTVPLLDQHTAMRVHREFTPVEDDYIATMWSLIRTIDRAIKHPKASEIEQGLGNLAMIAIERQIPYVREGLAI